MVDDFGDGDHERSRLLGRRLAPAAYALTIRVVSHDLDGKVTANVVAEEPAAADLKLKKTLISFSSLPAPSGWRGDWAPTRSSTSSPIV